MADTPALVARALAEMADQRSKLEQLAGVPLADPAFAGRLLTAVLDQQRVTWEFGDQVDMCLARANHIEARTKRLQPFV